MKKYLTALFCFLPSKVAILFLKIIGHNINWSCKIGFSIILVSKLNLEKGAKIGHFNFIKIGKIYFKEKAYIGHLNIIKGPFSLNFDKQGAIGNYNTITRPPYGVVYGNAELKLGELTKITAKHRIDMIRNVIIDAFSTLAGENSQIWTHGYIHGNKGLERIRIDGEVHIKNNVYIGSNCVINAGITVGKGITVGSNSVISKDLIKEGMYVSQPLRFIEKNINDVRNSLEKVEDKNLVEDVYKKN